LINRFVIDTKDFSYTSSGESHRRVGTRATQANYGDNGILETTLGNLRLDTCFMEEAELRGKPLWPGSGSITPTLIESQHVI